MTSPPVAETLVEQIAGWAARRPERPAYVFIDGALNVEAQLSFAQLWDRASTFARGLRALGFAHRPRAAMLFEGGEEFLVAFLGVLLAGGAAAPLAPPSRRTPDADPMYQRALRDLSPAVLLVGESFRACGLPGLETAWCYADVLARGGEHAEPLRPPLARDLAILQYTSGSTGPPKAVMVRHGNLIENSAQIYRAFRHGDDTRVFSWLPHYHDMGLVGGILQSAFGGFTTVLATPMAFIQRPLRWLQGISDFRCTVSGAPNFAYEGVLRRLPPERLALDLSRWKLAFVGAEPISARTLERFAEALAPYGFRRESFFPCYGMAESTLIATGGFIRAAAQWLATPRQPDGARAPRGYPSCGPPMRGHELQVVDPRTGRRVGEGEVGEAWLRGGSVAAGYWRRPEETAAAFDQMLDGRRGYFRTGDLGFLSGGSWTPTGRLKEIVIVRGRNFSSAELETAAGAAHPLIQPAGASAFAVHEPTGDRFVLVVEAHRHAAAAALRDEIRAAAQHALISAFGIAPDTLIVVRQGMIPRTTSGKVARAACRDLWRAGAFEEGCWSKASAPTAGRLEPTKEPLR